MPIRRPVRALVLAGLFGAIRGREPKFRTVGLNRRPNNIVRFLLSHQWINVDRLNATGGNLNPDVNVVSLGSQFAF